METCPFCDRDFDEERALHLHMGEAHTEALNSHQQDQVKAARRAQEREQEQRGVHRKQRIRRFGLLFAGLLAFGLVAALGMQVINISATSTPSEREKGPFNLSGQPVMGAEDTPVTVVEFGDYRCPFCKQFDTQVFPRLKEDYIDTGEIRFAFINLAFLGPGSAQAAAAGECVRQQDEDAFWDFHHALYERQGPESERWVSTDLLVQLGSQHDAVDQNTLRACIENEATRSAVTSDRALAETRGVTSTPTVFVNGKKLQGWRYATVSAAIEEALP